MNGIQKWLYKKFPIFKEHLIPITEEDLDEWQYDIFEELIEDTIDEIYDEQRAFNQSIEEMMDTMQHRRLLTSIFVASDRFDIEHVYEERFSYIYWLKIDKHIKRFFNKRNNYPLGKINSNAQKS